MFGCVAFVVCNFFLKYELVNEGGKINYVEINNLDASSCSDHRFMNASQSRESESNHEMLADSQLQCFLQLFL